jgi:hypothetical protein
MRLHLKTLVHYATPLLFVFLSVPISLPMQLLQNLLKDFNETWFKERSQCEDEHVTRGKLFPSHF